MKHSALRSEQPAELNGRPIILDHYHHHAYIWEYGHMVILPGAYWEWVGDLVTTQQAYASNA